MKFFIIEDNKIINLILADSKEIAEQVTGATAIDASPFEYSGASIGWVYDTEYEKFRDPRAPYPSWKFDYEQWDWLPPVPRPEDGGFYLWDEETTSWVEVTAESE